jgi:hypothetical protein
MSDGPRIGTRLRPAPTLITIGLALDLLIAVPLAIDLQRLSTRAGTASAYLDAARHGDCDRLIDLRAAAPRRAGIKLAGTTLMWCQAQGGDARGVQLVLRKVSGHWRVETAGPCQVLPQAWRDVEASCNLPTS